MSSQVNIDYIQIDHHLCHIDLQVQSLRIIYFLIIFSYVWHHHQGPITAIVYSRLNSLVQIAGGIKKNCLNKVNQKYVCGVQKKGFAMITYTIFQNADQIVIYAFFYFNIYNIKLMKKKQLIDFSFQVIKTEDSNQDIQRPSQNSLQIIMPQCKPLEIHYRHLNQRKSQQIIKPNRILDIHINDKINRISQQLQQNIKKRMQLQSKLNQVKAIQKKKNQKELFMAYNHNTYKQTQQQARVFKKINEKADKITQFTQKQDNIARQQLSKMNSLQKNKQILLNFDEPMKTQQKQRIIIPILQHLASNKRHRQIYTVPDQIKIQNYLRKVTFPEVPKENLQKLKIEVQNLFSVHSPHSDIHYLCMIINFHLKKYLKVRKFFEQIVNFKIFNQQSYWIAAQSQLMMQNYDLCLKLTEQCIDKLNQKLLPRFLYLKAKCYEQIGNYINSIICYNQLIKIRPKISEYYLQRGIIYHRVGYYKESKEDFVTFGILKPQAEQFIKDKILAEHKQIRKRQYIALLARMF